MQEHLINLNAKELYRSSKGRSVLLKEAHTRNMCISLIDGSFPPKVKGVAWHYETKGGRIIYHPSAYSKKGWSNMCYVNSTLKVEVGKNYIVKCNSNIISTLDYLENKIKDFGFYINRKIYTANNKRKITYSLIDKIGEVIIKDLTCKQIKKYIKKFLDMKVFI